MTERMSTSLVDSVDTNCQMNSESAETMENFGPTHSTQSTYENDIRKSLKILNKYYKSFCNEFEATLQKSILSYISLESKLALVEELKQVHFSNAASCGASSTGEVEHVQNMSISSSSSNGSRQGDIDQINIVVSVQSHLQDYENEILFHHNLLTEMKDPIYMLKGNIGRVHREVKKRLNSYFKNNEVEKVNQKQKTTELEEKLSRALSEVNSLQDKTKELDQELKRRNDELKELELKLASQQMSATVDQVEHVHNSSTDISRNVRNALNETDFHREVSLFFQNLQENGTTSQQRSTVVEGRNDGFITTKRRLMDAYRHILTALKSNHELRNKLKIFEEVNKEQKRRISELEESRVSIQKESISLSDLVEAFEEELALKNDQLKSQQETLANIQGKLISAEDELKQLRRLLRATEDSTVQVLPDLKANEVAEATSLEDYADELPESRQQFNQSNEVNEADLHGTDTTVVSQIVLDQEEPELAISQRKEEEMPNQIINLKEHSTLLEQMLVDAEEMNLKLREDLVKTEEKKDDTIDTLHRLNDNLREDLNRKNIQLDMQERNIADLQEQLELAEQKLKQPVAMENQVPLNIHSQTQLCSQRIRRLEVKSVEQDVDLDNLKQRCEANEETMTFISDLLKRVEAQTNSRSKKHLSDLDMTNLITELEKIRQFLTIMRLDQRNTQKTFRLLRSEIDYLRKDRFTEEQQSVSILTSVVNETSSSDSNDSAVSTNHSSSSSSSSREYEQNTLLCTSSSSESTKSESPDCTFSQGLGTKSQNHSDTEMILRKEKEENVVENTDSSEDLIITEENQEKTQYIESPNSSLSAVSSPKYYSIHSNRTSEKDTIVNSSSTKGSSLDVVDKFLSTEQTAQRNDEESKVIFSGAPLTLPSPSEEYVEDHGAFPRKNGFRASLRRILRIKGNCRVACETQKENTFTDINSDQNNNIRSQRALLLEKIRSGAPFTSWDGATLAVWLDQWVGMPYHYVAICRANVKSGVLMSSLTDEQMECELKITNPLHKLKLRVAIREMVSFSIYPKKTITRATLAFRELNHRWIGNYWLPSLGLPQHRNKFMDCLVDARMLNHLTEDHLQRQLKMKNAFHRASIYYGLICLKIFDYDNYILEERRTICENTMSDVLVWTNARLIKWISSIGFEAWANNLKDSGLHGAIIALNNDFDADNLASLLKISKRNVVARRNLTSHFNTLIQNATERF